MKYLPKKSLLRTFATILLVVFMSGQLAGFANALSPDQRKVYQEGINYFDTEVCGDTGGSGSPSVTAGTGTPTGLTFPQIDPGTMSDAINTYVKQTNPSSDLNNLGATLVASAQNANINPFLVVAIAQQESNLSDPSNYNVQHGSNSFGRTADTSKGQPSFHGAHTWYYWPSVKASVDYTDPVNQKGSNSDETAFLADEYGSFIKNNDLSGLIKKYDPNPSEYEVYIPAATQTIKKLADMTGQNGGGSNSPSNQGGGSGSSTIVLDPGHAPKSNINVDPDTKLPVFDYENDPEMQQVWQVAQDVKSKLTQDGYTVLVTKSSVDDSSTNLKQRAEVGNNANAALGVSLHTTPPPGNQVYYPAVGDYVNTTDGKKDVYNNNQLAGTDKQDASTLAQALSQSTGQNWQSGTYSNLASPTITRVQDGITMTGNMLTTQYFAKVPWVYAEQQQTSSKTVSNDMLSKYEDGVVKGVEQIVPAPANTNDQQSSTSLACCPPGASTPGDGTVPTSLTGGDNQTQAYNFLLQVGLSPAQAAGVVANLFNESSVNPLVSGSDPNVAAFGIAQWTPGSKFSDDKSKNNITGPDGSLLTQLQVLWAEMNGKSTYWPNSLIPGLEKISDPGDAAVYFRDNFENCDEGYSSCSDRASVGEQKFQELANGSNAATTPSASNDCVNPAASPDCQTATGNAKILCEAKQYDTVSYSQSLMEGNHLGSNKTWLNLCKTVGPKCYLDCSGLVNIAVYDAFGYDLQENTTAEAADSTHWKHISVSDIQPGDLIQPDPGHVEIIDHVAGDKIFTFGAHTDGVPQPDQVGPTSYPKDPNYVYLRWVGQGAS